MVLRDRIAAGAIVLDGGVGIALMQAGVLGDGPPEAALLSHPDAVRAVHASHVAAGAEAIYTNTLGANRVKLALSGLGDRAVEINRTAVEIARSVSPGFVIGSMGSTGKMIEPFGDMTTKEAADAYREQAEALVKAGVDGIVAETFFDLREILLAVREAREAGAAVVMATMTFQGAEKQYRTLWGTPPEQAVQVLRGAGADAVGANCGGDTPGMVVVIGRMRAADPDLPLVAKPNAGTPVTVDGKMAYRMGPEEFAGIGVRLRDAGANLIGGCCGTTAEHINVLSRKLKAG